MLTEVRKHIRFIFTCVRYNLAKEMENRVAFIMQVAGMFVNNGIMILQWAILFSINNSIGGYAFNDVVLLWGLSAATFGVAHTLFFNSTLIPAYITGGKLDAYLVQPKNVLINVVCSKMSVSAIGDMIYGVFLVLVLRADIMTFFMFLFFMLTGGIILASFYTITGSLAFWLRNSEDLSAFVNSIPVTFGTYPEGLFSGITKWLLFTLIPIGFIAYIPVRIFRTFDLVLFLAVVVFTIAIALTAFVVFNKGLKKYNSGNLMSSRI